MNTETIQAMKELIAKQTECIDILVDRSNNLFKDRKGCSVTQEYKTAEDTGIKPLPENCNDVNAITSYLESLNYKLYWTSAMCCHRELDLYAWDHFDTPEGRKTWYHMEWTRCGIPDFVHGMLGKYPSYTDDFDGSVYIYDPRGNWDWEKMWEDGEVQIKELEAHRKWYESLSAKEKEVYDKQSKEKLEQYIERQNKRLKETK